MVRNENERTSIIIDTDNTGLRFKSIALLLKDLLSNYLLASVSDCTSVNACTRTPIFTSLK